MKKIMFWVLTVAMLITSLVGCAEKLPPMPQVDHTSFIVNDRRVYNRVTGELSRKLCEDVECAGDCIFEAGRVGDMVCLDGALYFGAYNSRSGMNFFRKDLLSGEIVLLYHYDNYRGMRHPEALWIDDNRIYYKEQFLREESSGEDYNDYQTYLCSMTLEGTENTRVCLLNEQEEMLVALRDGELYTNDGQAVYATDLHTLQKRQVYPVKDLPFTTLPLGRHHNGKQVFVGYSIEAGGPMIASIDEATGEWQYLVDMPVYCWYFSEDTIYFWPAGIRQINAEPERYNPEDDDYAVMFYPATMYACDLDGNNIRPVWTDESGCLDYGMDCVIIDDVLYGWMRKFDQKTNTWSERFYGELHFDTGEVIRAIEVD